MVAIRGRHWDPCAQSRDWDRFFRILELGFGLSRKIFEIGAGWTFSSIFFWYIMVCEYEGCQSWYEWLCELINFALLLETTAFNESSMCGQNTKLIRRLNRFLPAKCKFGLRGAKLISAYLDGLKCEVKNKRV